MTYSTRSFTLKHTPHREYDRIYTLYTRDYGKLEVIARGSQKITSKLRGHLEQGICSEILLAQGKGRDVLCEAQSSGVSKNLVSLPLQRQTNQVLLRLLYLQKFLFQFDRLTHLQDKDIRLFDLLGDFIAELNGAQKREEIDNIYSRSTLWLMQGLGYK